MFFVVNLGLKSIRGILFTEQGEQIYSKAYPVHTTLFHSKVEQDPQEWLELLEKILKDLRDNTDLSGHVKFITVTTSSSCILGLDENKQPVTKVLMVSDKRSSKEVKEIQQSQVFQNFKKKGVQCATSSLVPKALWFKNNEPEKFYSVKHWLGAGEFLNLYFTGEFFTDSLNASKAFFVEGSYANSLLDSVGLETSTLPQVEKIGTKHAVLPQLIKKYKLRGDCTFILTTYDAICAVIGSNTGDNGNACDVSGTVTSVRMLSEDSAEGGSNTLLSQKIDLLDKYLVGSSNNLGGGIIEWHKQAFFKKSKSTVYSKMENAAQRSKVGSNGIIFLPYLLGERSPFIMPNASATFFGVKRNSTINDFTRAIFESTAYVTRDLLDLIINDGGKKVESLTVSGGLARFDLINQIKADVCNIPVQVVDNFESTSIGSFMLAAISTGVFSDINQASNRSVKIRKVINPSEKNSTIYDKYFDLFKDVNQSLMSLYDRHKQLMTVESSHENEIVRNL